MTKRELIDALADYSDYDEIAVTLPGEGLRIDIALDEVNEEATLRAGRVVLNGHYERVPGMVGVAKTYILKNTISANGKRRGRPPKVSQEERDRKAKKVKAGKTGGATRKKQLQGRSIQMYRKDGEISGAWLQFHPEYYEQHPDFVFKETEDMKRRKANKEKREKGPDEGV